MSRYSVCPDILAETGLRVSTRWRCPDPLLPRAAAAVHRQRDEMGGRARGEKLGLLFAFFCPSPRCRTDTPAEPNVTSGVGLALRRPVRVGCEGGEQAGGRHRPPNASPPRPAGRGPDLRDFPEERTVPTSAHALPTARVRGHCPATCRPQASDGWRRNPDLL